MQSGSPQPVFYTDEDYLSLLTSTLPEHKVQELGLCPDENYIPFPAFDMEEMSPEPLQEPLQESREGLSSTPPPAIGWPDLGYSATDPILALLLKEITDLKSRELRSNFHFAELERRVAAHDR